MNPHARDPDLIELVEDDPGMVAPVCAGEPWTILVVDDDEEVHRATRFALREVRIQGRPLALQHMYSASEVRARLQPAQAAEPMVILLDVVMETEDAGLALVDFIRDACGFQQTRIVLRTGQPGYAPELDVLERYDINDYRTKSELTRTRLISTLSTALRSYEQLRTIAENRRGLELIVGAASDLLEQHSISGFATGVLTQLAALLKVPLDGIVCAQRGSPFDRRDSRLFVVGAAGSLATQVGQPLASLNDSAAVQAIEAALRQGGNSYSGCATVIVLRAGERDAAVYIETRRPLAPVDRQLLEVFAANISACYGNVELFAEVNFIAYHDLLTGLGNRARLIRDLDRDCSQGTPGQMLALLDLQHFADLNDGLGHDVGNLLLVAVAARLRDCLSARCRLARIGADVFGILGPASEVAPDALFSLMEAPFAAGEHQLLANATIGFCALSALDGADSLLVLKRAGIALSHAKHSLQAYHEYFQPEMEETTRSRLQIIGRLRSDFHAGALEVWYQPQVRMADGAVCGIEALIRWPGDGGFVQPPSAFVPLAEYSGLIVDIGYFVLERACAALVELDQLPGPRLRVAVNVSMAQFRRADFVQRVIDTLAHAGIEPPRLDLEITESIAMDEPKVVQTRMQALRAQRIRLSIDDFGTGYSSLGHLRTLPIDAIKIDQGFVREIAEGRGGMFAESIVALGRRLGVETVAEGVETAEQAGFLKALGCDEAQGFLYARPMPLGELTAWLRDRR